MKFVALISGGKDSIFNIDKCIKQGHQLVALGNLYNETCKQFVMKEQGKQLDSYMYQTVTTNITITIAQAMQKPIYRQAIKGKPKLLNLEYQGNKEGDQVQDLYELLLSIQKQHPQIKGVSTGAIFSTYQKARVENICQRLNLVALNYLWHRQQSELLQEMITSNIQAVIVKVASYGLNSHHLLHTIEQLKPYFLKMQQQCGMNVCGEGGEYETLVLNCKLYHKKIIMYHSYYCSDKMEIIHIDTNELAPVAYVKILQVHLQ